MTSVVPRGLRVRTRSPPEDPHSHPLAMMRLAEELAHVGYWSVDAGDTSPVWSDEVYRIHGMDPAGPAPTLEEAFDAYHPDDRTHVRVSFERAVEGPHDYDFEARLVRTDGTVRVVQVKGRPELDASGALIRVAGVIMDITEPRMLEARRERLERDERLLAVGQLAAGVAHEINNPLAFVSTNLWAIKRDMSVLDRRGSADHAAFFSRLDRMVDACLDGAERLRTIVAELGSFSRQDDRATPLQLDEVARGVIHMMRGRLTSGCTIQGDLQSVPVAFGVPTQVGQIVTNLIANADQALRDHAGPRALEVRSWTQDGSVFLSVDDSGPGIPPAIRRRIFDPFFTTKGPHEGSGLGLALSAEIAGRFGGRLTLQTSRMGGAKFQLELPAAPAGTEPSVDVASLAPAPGPRPRVLIVDDEEALLDAYRRLYAERYELVTVPGGRAALSVLEAEPPFDVIVCDLLMPGMDGPALHAHLERTHPEVARTMVFSSGAALNDRARAFTASVPNRCLQKPVSPKALAELLARSPRSDD